MQSFTLQCTFNSIARKSCVTIKIKSARDAVTWIFRWYPTEGLMRNEEIVFRIWDLQNPKWRRSGFSVPNSPSEERERNYFTFNFSAFGIISGVFREKHFCHQNVLQGTCIEEGRRGGGVCPFRVQTNLTCLICQQTSQVKLGEFSWNFYGKNWMPLKFDVTLHGNYFFVCCLLGFQFIPF